MACDEALYERFLLNRKTPFFNSDEYEKFDEKDNSNDIDD